MLCQVVAPVQVVLQQPTLARQVGAVHNLQSGHTYVLVCNWAEHGRLPGSMIVAHYT